MATARTEPAGEKISATAAWRPRSEEERNAVRSQLDRILTSSLFRNSNRYPRLLRFSVEAALDQPDRHLKERVVGVEVFGRDPDYDTNVDPIVRATAVEVRKRIAEYYRQPGREAELRIDLPAGSYVAEIREPVTLQDACVEIALPAVVPGDVRPPSVFPRAAFLVAVSTLALIAAVVTWRWLHADALEAFWNPVIEAQGDVTVVIPKARFVPDPAQSVQSVPVPDQVGLPAAKSMAMVTGFLQSHKKAWRVRMSPLSSLAELREGPLVLIGAFNNRWTLQLTEPLRYGFVRAQGLHAIVDHQNPSKMWKAEGPSITEDYGLVASTIDRITGERVVIAAGLWQWGSTAASEFITDSSYMKELARTAPRGWGDRNVEVIVATKVIGESSGPPRIVASYFW